MTSFIKKYGSWALVTGAARGLGAEFAHQVAEKGLNVVLVDVSKDLVTKVAKDVAKKFSVETKAIAVDLASPTFFESVKKQTAKLEIGLLINNAGISVVGHFLDVPLEKQLQILDLNVRASMILAHHFGGLMRKRKRGGIIFVSSMSGLVGTSFVSGYSATKAYGLTLGEALWQELRSFNVDVLSTIVGATDTPGWRAENPNPGKKTWPPVMPVQDTVSETLNALGKTPSFVPGSQNRLATLFSSRLLSRKSAVETVGKEMDKRYGEEK